MRVYLRVVNYRYDPTEILMVTTDTAEAFNPNTLGEPHLDFEIWVYENNERIEVWEWNKEKQKLVAVGYSQG